MRKLALVKQLDVAARIDGMGSGDIEDASKRSSRNRLIPRPKHSAQCEAAPRGIGKELVKFVAIRIDRVAVVRGGVIEFLKEKRVLPMGIVEGTGKQQLQAILELIA